MARAIRVERVGQWYHVIARGNERKAIFLDDADRRHFLKLLGKMVETFRIVVHAYVLMNNHYHLIVELTEANLARAMQWLNVSYSVWFNRRRQRSGHLLQGRYKAIVVDPLDWGLELSRYVHLNPVRVGKFGLSKTRRAAGRVGAGEAPTAEGVPERLSYLRAYRWSSYRAYIGAEPTPVWLTTDRVLNLGGRSSKGKRQAYRDHIETAVREGLGSGHWDQLREQLILGGEEFVRRLSDGLTGEATKHPGFRGLQLRPRLEQVIAAVEKRSKESRGTISETVMETGGGNWCCIWDEKRAR